MGNNYVKQLGISTNTTLGTKEFNSIWTKYADKDDTITRKQAMKFLQNFAEAIKVDWSKDKGEKLLEYADPTGARKLTKEDFTTLFLKTAEEAQSHLSQSLIGAKAPAPSENVKEPTKPAKEPKKQVVQEAQPSPKPSKEKPQEEDKKEDEEEDEEGSEEVIQFVEKETVKAWSAPAPHSIKNRDLKIDPNRTWISQQGGVLSSQWTKQDFLLAPYVDIREDKQKEAIDLVHVGFRAEVSGLVSRATVEMTFFNHSDRELEGELQFPLPDEATITGFGLDVDGVIVAASLVEKERARQIFEQEVRKKVDPGLVEVIKGNQFRTRIYPLPAKGTRTVSITYVTQLETRDDAPGVLILKHPLLLFKSVVLDLQIAVVHDAKRAPVFIGKDLEDQHFKESEYSAGLSYYGCGFRATEFCSINRGIEVHIPFDETHPRVFVEKSEIDNEYYFAIQDLIPEYKATNNTSYSGITRVAIFWDSSLSRAIDKKREYAILDKFLSGLDNDCAVDVVPFHYRQENPTSFSAKQKDEVIKFLTDCPVDGCTRFDTLHLPHKDKKTDLCLIFTDGMSSVGDDIPPGIESFPPMFIIGGNSSATNHLLLRFWASQTGGAYFDLSKVKSDDTIAAQIGTNSTLAIVSISADQDDHITEVYPRGIVSVASKGKFATITGKLSCKATTVKINYGLSKHHIVATNSHNLQQQGDYSSGLVALVWAQQRLEYLATMEERNKDQLLALGRKFGIVTPGTSLLVLETLAQHLEHKVEPHPSRTQLYAEYKKFISAKEKEEEAKIKAKLERVKSWWQSRVTWWNKDFSYSMEPKSKDKVSSPSHRSERQMSHAPREMELRRRGSGDSDKKSKKKCKKEVSSKRDEKEKSESIIQVEEEADCSGSDGAGSTPDVNDSVGAKIAVKYWDPQTPYLTAIKEATKEKQYYVYLKQRDSYKDTAAFYFDCAHHFYHHHGQELGTRILSNIVELKLDNHQLLRIAAYKLDERGEWQLSSELFGKVLKLRPDEPQSYRDLALVLEKLGQFQRAAELLWRVIEGPNWSSAYAEIEVTALYEFNALLEKAQGYQNYYRRLGIKPKKNKHKRHVIKLPNNVDPTFIHNIDVDLRISMAWDTDNTDMDLHVLEPTGEEANYSNRNTKIGGLNSRDFTQGYGPEEYMVKKAYPGTYVVKTNYFGSSQASLTGPTTLLLSLFTNYGRPNQECQMSTIRLQGSKDNNEIGRIDVDPSKWNK